MTQHDSSPTPAQHNPQSLKAAHTHTPTHTLAPTHPPTHPCRQDEFAATGVSGELYSTIDKALDERTIGHNPERLSLLKGGIVYSNAVTTVSPTYAREILQGGAAGWMRTTLARPEISAKVRRAGACL